MKLKSFYPSPIANNIARVGFTFSRANKDDLTVYLTEKPSWPLIWGADLDKVEQWITKQYSFVLAILE